MKYIKFLISLNKKSTLLIVLSFLIISTLLEYAFVGTVPLLLNIVFKSSNIPNFLFFHGTVDRQILLRYVLIIILFLFLLKNIFYFLNQFFVLNYSFNLHNNLSKLLISKYLNDKYLVFINSKTSELLRNVKDNTDLVRQLVTNSLTFFSEILVFAGLCFIIIYNSSLISIFSIIFINCTNKFVSFNSQNSKGPQLTNFLLPVERLSQQTGSMPNNDNLFDVCDPI